MLCHRCGAHADEQSNFCAVCGANLSSSGRDGPARTRQEPGVEAQPLIQSPVKKMNRLRVVIPACILLIAATCAALYFFVFSKQQTHVNQALSGLRTEFAERFGTMPFVFLPELNDVVENGTIEAEFSAISYDGKQITGILSLLTDMKNYSYAVETDLNLYGQSIDLSLYVNDTRAAIGSSAFDDGYYGITYDTFKQDIRGFINQGYFDENSIKGLTEVVDMMSSITSLSNTTPDFSGDYSKVMTDFINSLNPATSKSPLPSGGKNYDRVDYVIPKEKVVGLLREYFDTLSGDDALSEHFDSILKSHLNSGDSFGFAGFDDFLSGFKAMIDAIENGLDGTVTVSFYLDGDRLIYLKSTIELVIDKNTVFIEFVCDFGSNAYDTWLFSLALLDINGNCAGEVSMRWEYNTSGNNHVNKIMFTTSSGGKIDTFSIVTSWAKEGGAFSLTVNDGVKSEVINGSIYETSDGIVLELFNLGDKNKGESLEIKLSFEKGCTIADPAYVNLDKWDPEMIYALVTYLAMTQ